MKDRLSASDMSTLFAEGGRSTSRRRPLLVEGAPPAYDELVAHVENRLDLVPRFRQRIVKVPLGIENPVWADDPGSTSAATSATSRSRAPAAWTSSAT